MSGIAALVHLDGRPLEASRVEAMLSLLRRRGPDGTGVWTGRAAGLGHTALHSTPEAAAERQPSRRGTLAVAADARLDNRQALLRTLELPPACGEAELIGAAYERWGEGCPERLEGDFAFALWDGAAGRLFCARDRFGVRPLYLHHQPNRLLALASEPAAILALEDVPYRINQARVADFLVTQLEGIDLTSTFFEDVERLPPAYALSADRAGVRIRRYWELTPGRELRLESDQAYVEAFLEVFTEAVRRRLRGADTVGSMLSGGMDSGSVVAVAAELRSRAGEGPLPVFSAVGTDPERCAETAAIRAVQGIEGVEPNSVIHTRLGGLLPEITAMQGRLAEPFDYHMAMLRAVYLLARRRGLRAVLDGIDGDTIFAEGSYVTQLLRRGHWLRAWREASGRCASGDDPRPTWRALAGAGLHAFAPRSVRRLSRAVRGAPGAALARRNIASSLISTDFARRVGLADRLEALRAHTGADLSRDLPAERARAIRHPYLTVGVERYNRTASALGLEPRHPFLDRPVVELALSLPPDQKLADGWPKVILRRAAAGRLPDHVRWRRGREHLGWAFTTAVIDARLDALQGLTERHQAAIEPYVDLAKLDTALKDHHESVSADSRASRAKIFEAITLAEWLSQNATRPVPEAPDRPLADL